MKLKTNLFERITQHYYEDGCDIHWWIDDDEEEEFLNFWDENDDLKKTDARVISGKEWNEFWIGGIFGDYEGEFVNEVCECGHLLIKPNRHEDYFTETERHCSDCEWENNEMTMFWAKNKEEWKGFRDPNKPPELKLRLAGEDIFDFAKRVGLQLEKRDKFYIKDDNYWTECVVCERTIPADDFYIGQGTGMAMITFSHDDCKNGGPCVATPFKKETKEKWNNILGG